MPRCRSPRQAFSLIEVAVTIAILAFALTLTIESYGSIAQAAAITTAADRLSDQLREAREQAVAQNTTVEFRFYKVAAQPGTTPAYNTSQLRWVKADGTTPAITQPLFLPNSVVIDETVDHSPLIISNTLACTADTTDVHLNSDTRVIHFLPDGSTDLATSTRWFLTLRATTQSDPAHFPTNWAAISLDPSTARVQIYRP